MEPSEVDTAYIDQWASTLGLTDAWRAILDRLREPLRISERSSRRYLARPLYPSASIGMVKISTNCWVLATP